MAERSETAELTIIVNGDGGLADVPPENIVDATGLKFRIMALPGGMARSGAASVAVAIDMPDGKTLFAQTSLALLLTAADAFKAKHGDPRTGAGGSPKSSPISPADLRRAVKAFRHNGREPTVAICSPLERQAIKDEAIKLGLQVKHHPAVDAGTVLVCDEAQAKALLEGLT